MNTIKIDGNDVELCFNVSAMNKIGDLCGGEISNIGETVKGMTEVESCNFFCEIICALANGAKIKHNSAVSLGLENGNKKQLFDADFFKANMEMSDIDRYTTAIFETMGMGSAFIVPDNVKIEEKDIDLAEIEAEKSEGNL